MIGSNNLNACCVCSFDDLCNNIITGEHFHVDQIYQSALSSLDVKLFISIHVNGFLAAFFSGTEGKQDRNIAERRIQLFQNIFYFSEIKNVLKPVNTPLNNIYRNCFKCLCFGNDLFLSYANDRYTDLRDSFTDGNISNLYWIHMNTSSLK